MSSSGPYIAYTGAAANLATLEVIANNVANADTTGFKRDRTLFDSVLGANMPFVRAESGAIDLRPGTARLTGIPLHAALQGDGFFVVRATDGSGELLTRRGDFHLDGSGRLVLPNGEAVLGTSGDLAVPPGADIQIRSDGTVLTPDGPAGRLRVVRVEDPSGLEKVGGSLLRLRSDAKSEEVGDPQLAIGFVEESNVNLAAEMVALIQNSRAFEASMQSLRINDEITQRLIQVQT
jgi:flagellar basal body rod protein FlgG